MGQGIKDGATPFGDNKSGYPMIPFVAIRVKGSRMGQLLLGDIKSGILPIQADPEKEMMQTKILFLSSIDQDAHLESGQMRWI